MITGSSLVKPERTWSIMISTIGAVDALTRALAIDLAPIRVNVVCPGLVKRKCRGHLNAIVRLYPVERLWISGINVGLFL